MNSHQIGQEQLRHLKEPPAVGVSLSGLPVKIRLQKRAYDSEAGGIDEIVCSYAMTFNPAVKFPAGGKTRDVHGIGLDGWLCFF